jgi:DNA-binding NarL/FixJ family response regulator
MNRVRPRLLLVDDHPLAREGLRAVLAGAGYDIVGDAADGEAAVRLAIELRPDLVLMDVRLGPGIDGLEATRQIVALGLSARVLMLTLHDTPAYVREALAAGASGYVLKDTAIENLRKAIDQVLDDQTAVPLDLMAAAMRSAPDSRRPEDAVASLTSRERDVLRRVAQGRTNKEIGRELLISPATVKAHVERIIAKLGVTDRTQAAVLAARASGSDLPA